jgi:hypothetical protein
MAGGLNSTPIGATTPSTGAFTTLSATGNVTGQNLVTTNGGTSQRYHSIVNTGQSGAFFGVESSSPGGFFTGSSAYATVLYNTTSRPIELIIAGTKYGEITTTGFQGAIGATTPSTGAFTTLSATGNVTLGDAAGDTITANGTFGAVLSSSSIKSSSASGGVGYDTGAGGTVTQLTSKATSVTLNKTCGKITTHNASLANNTTVSFTVSNTSVGANDCVIPSIASSGGHTPGAYIIWIDQVAANSFTINLRNVSGGALAEILDINFAVIKGVTS